MLVSLQTLFVAVFSWFLFGERPGRRFWLAAPVALLGVALLNMSGGISAEDPRQVATGTALGLGAAVLYAAYLVGLRAVRRRRPELDVVTVLASSTLGILAAVTVAATTSGTLDAPPPLSANVWGVLFFGEPVTTARSSGLVLVLGATAVVARRQGSRSS